MKKNILVIDPSIMIHKIVQLAFPEETYNVSISEGYPVTCSLSEPLNLVLISADLPGQTDVHDVIAQLKNQYDCPMLLMIPKFTEFDTALARQAGVDETIEKPFTSDALKEKVAGISALPTDVDQMESLSAEELESITDDEFMLSEEDLMDIGEDDLADVEIPDDLPMGDEPDTSELPETEILAEPADAEPEPAALETETPAEPEIEMEGEEEPEAEAAEASDEIPFDDMEIEEDLDSIDFGDLDEDEQLLPEHLMDSQTEGEPAETGAELEPDIELPDVEEEQEAVLPEEPEAEPEPVLEHASADHEMEEAEEPVAEAEMAAAEETGEAEQPAPIEEPEMAISESDFDEAAGEEAEPGEDLVASTEDVFGEAAEPEDMLEPEFSLPEEAAEEDLTPEPEDDIDVNFAIEEEPRAAQMESGGLEEPQDVMGEDESEEDETEMEAEPELSLPPEPIDLSHAEEDSEIIHPPSSLRDTTITAGGALSKEDIDRIAQRVVALLGDKVLREIAWEVIPVVAEEVVRSRIRELEENSGD